MNPTIGFPVLLAAIAQIAFGGGVLSNETDGKMTSKYQDPLMVIFGASYAGGWGEPDLHGWRVINRGVSGDETSGMLARFDADVVAEQPDAVLIWGFINDIFRSERNTVEEKLTQTRSNFKALVVRARAAGVMPILATEVPIRHKKSFMSEFQQVVGRVLRKKSYQMYINSFVHRENEWLRSFAKSQCVSLLDLSNALSDEDGYRIRSYSADDGSHISPEGYKALSLYAAAHRKAMRIETSDSSECE